MRCLLLPLLAAAVGLLAAPAGTVHVKGTGHFGNLHYMILAPRIARLGSTYTVSCALLSGEAIVSARARISTVRMAEGARNLSAEDVWTSSGGQPGPDTLTLSLPLENDDAIDLSGSYTLSVELAGSTGSVYRNETNLLLQAPNFLAFVQTDKAVYQPGQTVKFRVFCLSDSLRPVAANFTVLVKDAQGNLVDRFRHEVSSHFGHNASQTVMRGQFVLADPPNLGTWRIEASGSRGQHEAKSFLVERYTLPKFTVEVQTPTFVHVKDKSFNVTVSIRYTYKQAVQGQLLADIGPWNSCRSCKNNYDLVKRFNVGLTNGSSEGRAVFTYPMDEWRAELAERANRTGEAVNLNSNFGVKVDVLFTEKFSEITKKVDKSFVIYGREYQLSMDIPELPFFLPGMRLPVKLLLKRPNGIDFTGNSPDDVRLWMDFSHRGKTKSLELYKGRLAESASGTGLSLIVTVPNYADFVTISVSAKLLDAHESQSSFSLKPYIATTNDFVFTDLLSGANGVQVRVNQSSGIKISFNAIVSNSQIRIWNKLDSKAQALVQLNPERIQEFIPGFEAVTFGVVESGEIVASYDKYSVPSVTGKLTLSSNLTDNTAEPQAGVSIGVAGEPDSFVFLTGIDASVNLIRSGQDILEDTVTGKLRSSVSTFREYWSRSYTTGTVLQAVNLLLLTDGFFEKEEYRRFLEFESFLDAPLERSSARGISHSAPPVDSSAQPEKSQKRTYFPETMLWTVVETDSTGRASSTLQLPDTITSWDVTAFGISSRHAVQTVQRPFQVTTFKRFFAQLTLPHSLIRGESLLLRVLLFNFDSANRLGVNVTLTIDSEAFELTALIAGQPMEYSTVDVEANGVGLAVFGLRPKLVAEAAAVTVRARAVWPDGRAEVDEVTRTLPVLPEGRTVRRAVTALLSLRSATGNNSKEEEEVRNVEMKIDWPEAVQADGSTLVPGSQLLSVSVVGDVLGPAMDGIGQLVRTPHGCGEQNMVDFAPAVPVYRYLRFGVSKDDEAGTARLRQKALDAMRIGYQRQLAFRRQDGSYSAFGSADPAGSAWLTAFVLSVYSQAAEFIAVDPSAVVGDSAKFLLSRQDPSGRFTEPDRARVLDSSLQGEAGSASLGMSAFICSALIDVQDAVKALPSLQTAAWPLLPVATALRRCVGLFEREFQHRLAEFDTRDLALAANFLWRARRSGEVGGATASLAARVWEAFNARAVTDGELRFWKGSEEVTAYAVLTALLTEERSEAAVQAALPALRWLTSRQTDRGGFSGTQSTVVGIRAIAAFATAVGTSGPTRAKVELLTSAEPIEVSIEPVDRRVIRRRLLGRGGAAAEFASVNVRATGSGLALATAAWQFNLRDPARRSLVADWTESSGLGLRLAARPEVPHGATFAFSVCARASGKQGMYILQISCPSGYSAEEFTKVGEVPGLQLVEAGPLQLVFYFDRLLENREVCVQSAWRRDVPVLNVQPQKITLQKYYQPELVNTVFYLDSALQSVNLCQACPDCTGCPVA